MALENEAMERELAGEDGPRVEITGATMLISTQLADHKYKLSDHAGGQIDAVKRKGGKPRRCDGKTLKDLDRLQCEVEESLRFKRN